jgi:hypothetical protein
VKPSEWNQCCVLLHVSFWLDGIIPHLFDILHSTVPALFPADLGHTRSLLSLYLASQ